MLLIIFILSLPFLMWVWLGIFFTILIYVAETISEKLKEAEMQNEVNTELARIIRYTDLSEFEANNMPGLLSFFEEGRNILHIDRQQAERLPEFMRNRLEMTSEVFTRVYDHGATMTFAPYNREDNAQSPVV